VRAFQLTEKLKIISVSYSVTQNRFIKRHKSPDKSRPVQKHEWTTTFEFLAGNGCVSFHKF